MSMNRRSLLKVSALAGGGLLLQMPLSGTGVEPGPLVGSKELNVYVQITSDGQITIYSATPEMGQGVKTTLPMIIAEEMGARWEDVKVIDAPLDEKFGRQATGGSTAIYRNYGDMRRMGASAREMLIGAAALLMEVDRDGLEARDSQVVHSSGASRSFGELATLAAQQPLPAEDQLTYKDPSEFTIIGTSVSGVDNLVIATGQSGFGIDVDIPGMKYASYQRCPREGGKAMAFNEAEIKRMPGIIDAFILEPKNVADPGQEYFFGPARLRGGVAIVGDDTWSVLRAKAALKVDWDMDDASTDDWIALVNDARRNAEGPGPDVKRSDEGIAAALADPANQRIEGFYQFPFVAHLCMEPMNCTAEFRPAQADKPASVELWMGCQFPAFAKPIAKNLLGVDPENVKVNFLRMGGGFGRRAILDFATEAMAISHRSGLPVKLTWNRTDDIHNDHFRAGGFEMMRGAVNRDGKIAAWDQHYLGFVRPDGSGNSGSGLRGNEMSATVVPNARVTQTMSPLTTSCGPWRAPGSNTNAFVEQCFLHELSHLAGRDHLEFLVELMGERRWLEEGNIQAMNTGRAIDVIRLAAEKAGWDRKKPAGTGLGLAFYFCHAAHVAEVAQVTVDERKNFHVDRVTVAVDVGPIMNRSGAITQVQGAVIDGLSTMALQQITMSNGEIDQNNLDRYPVMRIAATPEVDVHFIESDNQPTGLGEPALPPLAPAVGNAIFDATGERIRTMPFSEVGYTLV